MSPSPRPLPPLLEPAPLGDGRFEARFESHDGRTFGGEVLAVSVVAAMRSAPGRELHSLHGHFLRPLRPQVATEVRVEQLREGRRLAHQRLDVRQQGRLCAAWQASLATPTEGPSYGEAEVLAGVPDPEALPGEEWLDETDWRPERPPLLDWRFVEHPWRRRREETFEGARAWVRPALPLPDDPALAAGALAYLSDFGSLGAIERRVGERFVWQGSVSLDHALWIHRIPRIDDYLLMITRSERAQAGRALSERHFHLRTGERVATVVQEALFAVAEVPSDPAAWGGAPPRRRGAPRHAW